MNELAFVLASRPIATWLRRKRDRVVGEVVSGFRVSVGGSVVVDPEQVLFLGHVAGVKYNPSSHKLHNCACCQNLFVSTDDTPRLCHVCSGGLKHKLEAPLPEPKGAIS